MTARVIATGLESMLKFVKGLPETVLEAAYFAVNDTSSASLPLLKKRMRSQINFPNGYLNKDRLSVRRKATRATLEATISGRDRPTSLARFAPGATPKNSRRRPIDVRVRGSGKTVRLDRAFLLELKNGNTGLAIRLPEGKEPDRAYKPVQLTRNDGVGEGAWLLYGPSVDQVLEGVIPESTDEIQELLEANFSRHIDRLTRG